MTGDCSNVRRCNRSAASHPWGWPLPRCFRWSAGGAIASVIDLSPCLRCGDPAR